MSSKDASQISWSRAIPTIGFLAGALGILTLSVQAQEQAKAKGEEKQTKIYVTLTPKAAEAAKARFIGAATNTRLRISADKDGFGLETEYGAGFTTDLRGESEGVPLVVESNHAWALPAGLELDYGKDFEFQVRDPLDNSADAKLTLAEARKGFNSRLSGGQRHGQPANDPPATVFRKVQFNAPLGKHTAYLSPDPPDRKRRPAILWIGGGSNELGQDCWTEGPIENEQSAAIFRTVGLMVMRPGLRGTHDNPGAPEGFWGEVDDILAAAEFLKKHRYVDPKRIYLAGHSTGATLALLAAEHSDKFRAVFCIGAASNPAGYGKKRCPFFMADPREVELRAPIRWLHCVKCPVFLFEGDQSKETYEALKRMEAASKNKLVQFFSIAGANHFDVLAPVNLVIADRILQDNGPKCNVAFQTDALQFAFQKMQQAAKNAPKR